MSAMKEKFCELCDGIKRDAAELMTGEYDDFQLLDSIRSQLAEAFSEPPVIVTVSGGVVQHVGPVPLGVIVEVRDYDCDGSHPCTKTDEAGNAYECWRATAGLEAFEKPSGSPYHAAGRTVHDEQGNTVAVCPGANRRATPEDLRRARLFAAAPQLLDACKAALWCLKQYPDSAAWKWKDGVPVWSLCQAAIAAAETV